MTEQKPIVCILGNSVPLLIQPFRKNAEEKTYAEHLRDFGFAIINSAKQSAILPDLYYYLEDECIRHFPDFIVFDFGIVDCSYRTRTRWLQNSFSMNAWNNNIVHRGYNGPIVRGIKFIIKKIYRKTIERLLFALGLKRRWVSPKHFQFILRDVVKRLFSDTPVRKIIFVGMLTPNDWLEREAPGTRQSVAEYNAILETIAKENPNMVFFDPRPHQSANISSDGVHYTAVGHRKVAENLRSLLVGDRVDYTGWKKINQYKGLYRLYENWFKR